MLWPTDRPHHPHVVVVIVHCITDRCSTSTILRAFLQTVASSCDPAPLPIPTGLQVCLSLASRLQFEGLSHPRRRWRKAIGYALHAVRRAWLKVISHVGYKAQKWKYVLTMRSRVATPFPPISPQQRNAAPQSPLRSDTTFPSRTTKPVSWPSSRISAAKSGSCHMHDGLGRAIENPACVQEAISMRGSLRSKRRVRCDVLGCSSFITELGHQTVTSDQH